MNTQAPVKKLELIRSNFTNELTIDQTVREFVTLKAQLEDEIKTTWKALETYMLEHDRKDIDCLTIATKKNWKVEGKLPPRFYKEVVDTSELKHLFDKGKKLPKGASFTTTKYLTKTSRKVAA